jgi:hypothetical protein
MSSPDHDTDLKCPHCGYNLTALTSSRCPECGTPFALADATESPAKPPSGFGLAFLKGGLVAVVGFLVLGITCAMVGGHFYIDLCGGIALFAIGGLIGLGVHAIFRRGYRQGLREPYDR